MVNRTKDFKGSNVFELYVVSETERENWVVWTGFWMLSVN